MGIFDSIFGGKTKATTTDPAWYTGAAQNATDLAKKSAMVGYVPYMGADIAGFNPMQLQAMQQAGNRFATFNNPGGPATQVDQMPQTDFGGGLHGYSSYGGFQTQLDALEKTYPGIAAALKQFSVSPFGAVGAPRPPVASGPGSTGTWTPGTPYPAVQPPAPGPTPPPVVPGRGVHPRYQAWLAAHPGSTMTLEQWQAANRPGIGKPRTVAQNLGLGKNMDYGQAVQ